MNVNQVMTRQVATAPLSANLREVVGVMMANGCGWVPIVDAEGRPAGVITDRDVAIEAWRSNRRLGELLAMDAARREVVVCRDTSPVQSAEALMRTAHVRRIGVVDLRGRLVGMLSVDDLAQLAVRAGNRDVEGLSSEDVLNVVAEASQNRRPRVPAVGHRPSAS